MNQLSKCLQDHDGSVLSPWAKSEPIFMTDSLWPGMADDWVEMVSLSVESWYATLEVSKYLQNINHTNKPILIFQLNNN